jgi:alpha-L-fucosidase
MRWTLPMVAALAAFIPPAHSADSTANPIPAETREQFSNRMAWFREARFGMFIHWGIMSIPGRECWVMYNERIPVDEYEKLVALYNPTNFSAREIVGLAKEAGQKYVVFVAKHHDGFCMWNSPSTDYDIMATPFHRDIVRELADECQRQGLRFGLYYSILDWHHPYARWQHWPKYVTYMKAQLRELLTGYGPIAVLWFDGEWAEEWTDALGRDLYAYVRSLQPNIIINNRIGKGRVDMAGYTARGHFAADFDTPEQTIPSAGFPGTDWETCMTINHSWSWTKNDLEHKPASELLQMLADIASKNGNFLLNIGPRPDGSILADQQDRLRAMGRWLRLNGESIYGSTGSPFPRRFSWGRATTKPGRIFLHVFDWPQDGRLRVPGLNNPVAKAYLLSDPSHPPLSTSHDDAALTVTVPAATPDPADSVVVLEIDGAPNVDANQFLIQQSGDGSVALRAGDADLHGHTLRYDPQPGRQSIGYWTDLHDWVSWDFLLKKPGRFQVAIHYGCAPEEGGGTYIVQLGKQTLTARAR